MCNRWAHLKILFASFCLLAGLLFSFPSPAQRLIPRFETLSVDDGLSQNSIYTIYQDKHGFIWFGTANGLNRYDGETVRVFRAKSPPLEKVNINFVRGNICEDKSGRLWHANETGIYCFNPVTEQIVKTFDYMPPPDETFTYYHSVTLDKNENLWVIDPQKGLIKYQTKTGETQLVPFPDTFVANSYGLPKGQIGKYILISFPEKGTTIKFDMYAELYTQIFSDRPGAQVNTDGNNLFLAEGENISIYDSLSGFKFVTTAKFENRIGAITKDAWGRIWIASLHQGLYCYYPEQRRTENYVRDNSQLQSLPFNITTCLLVDTSNNLWIGTDGGGVTRISLKTPRFDIFPHNPGDYPLLRDYFTKCIYEDERKRIWFGTTNSGFSIFDPSDNSLQNFSKDDLDQNSIPSNTVTVILRDWHHNLWIGHDKGLALFDEKSKEFRKVPLVVKPDTLVTPIIYKILQLPDSDFLVGSGVGVLRVSKKQHGNYRGHVVKRRPNFVTDLILGSNGDLWVSTRWLGLRHFPSVEMNTEPDYQFFEGVHLRSMHVDEQNPDLFWICSGAGLIRFHSKTHDFKIYNQENGMPDQYLYGILEDKAHNLWMSSNSGIYIFNKENETFINYSVKNGLQSNEFNTGAFHQGASGLFYFGGINGFNNFDPLDNQHEPQPPEVRITSVYVNDKHWLPDSNFVRGKPLNLSYSDNDLAFSFAVIDYTRPEGNQVQYKLDGWDEAYITTGVKNVRYANLPPGNYTLRVRGTSDGQNWGKEELFGIHIVAPFWKTNLFYGLMVLIAIGGIIAATRGYYRQKLRRKLYELEKEHAVMQERERISKDMHDDLGTDLSSIVIMSELVRQKSRLDESTEKQLFKISELSRNTIGSFNELIWSHNPVNDSLQKLLWYFREHLGGAFEGTQAEFKVILPERIPDVRIQAEWRRNIFLITKEAIHNVLKHAKATQVELRVSIDGKRITIAIWDNGKGFNSKEKMNSGNGLTNMEKRAKASEGEIEIESSLGKGTLLTLTATWA